MELRVSLFRHLEKLIEVIGAPAAEGVLKQSTTGDNQFVISFDVNEIPLSSCSDLFKHRHLFIGHHPYNSLFAEHNAVMSVKKFLDQTFAVQIHDHSHSKIVKFELKIADILSTINSVSNRFQTFISQYKSSIKIPEHLLTLACSQNSSSVFTVVSESFSLLCNSFESSVDGILSQLDALDIEMTLYIRSVPIINLETVSENPAVCKMSEKDFLEDVLASLNLPAAKYIANLTGDFVTVTCIVDLGIFYGTNATWLINIQGEPKTNPIDAEFSAASHAISYLEHSKDFDVVDFNYDSFVVL